MKCENYNHGFKYEKNCAEKKYDEIVIKPAKRLLAVLKKCEKVCEVKKPKDKKNA